VEASRASWTAPPEIAGARGRRRILGRWKTPQSELEPHDEPELQLEPHDEAELQLEPHEELELQEDEDVELQLDALEHDEPPVTPGVPALNHEEERGSSGASTASLTLRPPPGSKLIASRPTQESSACARA
jgi:hypothetical protein